MEAIIEQTSALGFNLLMLDAVPQTAFAMKIYERMGFFECAPFYTQPVPGTRFFAMDLPA